MSEMPDQIRCSGAQDHYNQLCFLSITSLLLYFYSPLILAPSISAFARFVAILHGYHSTCIISSIKSVPQPFQGSLQHVPETEQLVKGAYNVLQRPCVEPRQDGMPSSPSPCDANTTEYSDLPRTVIQNSGVVVSARPPSTYV
jgi:hypothetical protein